MSIELPTADLSRALERAIHIARLGESVPATWIERVERLAELRHHKTYMAALGGALLAKAVDDRVDSLTHKNGQGARSYQLRKPTEHLAKHNNGRYDLGSRSPNPLNGSTFLNNDTRIDEFRRIMPTARPAYEHFRDCIFALNKLSSEEATNALAAYLSVRSEVANRRDARAEELLGDVPATPLFDLLRRADLFVNEDPEGGKRGEALVAAVFDAAFDDVRLKNVNSPERGDVKVYVSGRLAIAIEVKQHAVDESTGIETARDARALGAPAALLVVLSPDHAPLDRERIRRTAMREYRVAMAIAESVYELAHQAAVFAGGITDQLRERFPASYLRRLIHQDVSEAGVARWRDLALGMSD